MVAFTCEHVNVQYFQLPAEHWFETSLQVYSYLHSHMSFMSHSIHSSWTLGRVSMKLVVLDMENTDEDTLLQPINYFSPSHATISEDVVSDVESAPLSRSTNLIPKYLQPKASPLSGS